MLSACLADATSAAAQEPLPFFHWTRDAGADAQRRAHFGWTGEKGRLGDQFDSHDDVVVCAIDADDPSGSPTGADVGVGYVFENANLEPPLSPDQRRLLPKNPQDGQQLGRLSVAIGNTRGAGAPPLIFLSGFATTASYCEGTEAVAGAGSVEIFDHQNPQPGGHAVLSLVAPLHWTQPDPPWLVCDERVPFEVRSFGQGLVVTDVTGDGIDDLLVGAPNTNVGDELDLGRIYAFAGHANFLADPEAAWIGLNAPESADPASNSGSEFGWTMAAARLTDASSGLADVVVARIDKARISATSGQPKGGSAIVIRGDYLKTLFDGQDGVTLNTVSDPVHLEDLDPVAPEYQVLRNPFGDYQAAGPVDLWNDAFGWILFPVGDIGSPPEDPTWHGDPDGIEDVVVHGEGTDFIGPSGTFLDPEELGVGANFVYFGTGQETGALVDPDHLLLMTPENLGGPTAHWRFGRAMARVEWLHDREPPLMDLVEPALVISEPDATVGTKEHAGRVCLIRLPLPHQPSNGWEPAPIENAWGAGLALEDPSGPQAWAIFGGWILALDYWGNPQSQPGQQILITTRGAKVGSLAEAGKFQTFTPNQP